jgi:hypothetical protein
VSGSKSDQTTEAVNEATAASYRETISGMPRKVQVATGVVGVLTVMGAAAALVVVGKAIRGLVGRVRRH